MKSILTILISIILVVSGSAQTRNVVVDTNGLVVQPTNIWTANATNARSGLGLGSSATNPSSAFQSSSSVLSNLASSNGVNITNISSSNIVGIISISSGGTGATNAAGARTAFGLDSASTNPASAFQSSSLALSNLASSNGGLLTNITAANIVGLIPSSNIPSVSFTNISGTLSLLQGGTSATNAADARQNLGSTTIGDALFISTNAAAARTTIGATTVGSSLFTLINPSAITFLRINSDNTVSALSASDFRTALSLGSAATNLSSAFQPASTVLSNLASSNGVNLTNLQSSNITGAIAISNGGSGATTVGEARTNFGLGLVALTNVDNTTFRTAIELGVTNDVQFKSIVATNAGARATLTVDGGLIFEGSPALTAAALTRTNLQLGWLALTNTTASGFQTALFGTNTNPVLVNTNGEVVSPTNFWQASPANTRVQLSQPVVNATNTATNARNLYFYSLAISTTGVTNTVQLPTNGGTLLGDVTTVIHEGPTSSITAVRQIGSGTNLITLNQFQEAVKFIYESSGWRLADNISYVEPIYFSGTNAAASAAASRTNLGLGTTNNVNFARLELTDTTTNANLWIADQGEIEGDGDLFIGAGSVIFKSPIEFNNTTNAAATRTNLGIPLAALTNTSVTNFQKAIFYTNTAPSNIGGNLGTIAAWIEIVASNGVTYKIPAYTNVP